MRTTQRLSGARGRRSVTGFKEPRCYELRQVKNLCPSLVITNSRDVQSDVTASVWQSGGRFSPLLTGGAVNISPRPCMKRTHVRVVVCMTLRHQRAKDSDPHNHARWINKKVLVWGEKSKHSWNIFVVQYTNRAVTVVCPGLYLCVIPVWMARMPKVLMG